MLDEGGDRLVHLEVDLVGVGDVADVVFLEVDVLVDRLTAVDAALSASP